MAKRLIVIYNRLTGDILNTVLGGHITKRTQLNPHIKDTPLNLVSFYYEEHNAEIDLINDKIKSLVSGLPPLLLDRFGYPKLFDLFIKNRRQIISQSKKIKIDFEGGMGDQIMQLEALKVLKEQNPSLVLIAGIWDYYLNIIPHFTPIPIIAARGRPDSHSNFYFYTSNATNYISDPRGALYGKASLYGASIGLECVHTEVMFKMPEEKVSYWTNFYGIEISKKKSPLLGIHIRSGSGGAKSWNTEPAQALSSIWHTKTGGDVFLCGDPQNFNLNTPWAFTLPNHCDWAAVGAIIQNLDLLICIDSGPMHIARSAGIPHLILWGGTGPDNILGRPLSPIDIRADIPCIDNICYSCPHGTSLCMRAITPGQVWQGIEKNFPHILTQPCENLT